MDEQETDTVESIDTQIAKVRSNPDYLGEKYRHNTIEQKALQVKMHSLYEKKRALSGQAGNQEAENFNKADRPPGEPASFNKVDDLPTQAQAELGKLAELGIDVSKEATDDMTPERLDGIKHLRLIEEGDFQAVAPMLSKAAIRAGLPAEDISMIRQMLPRFKDPDAKGILREVANYIYNKRTQGS